MPEDSQGIPNLPDLTHPEELINFGTQIFNHFLTITLILIAFGLVLGFLAAGSRHLPIDRSLFLEEWFGRYTSSIRGFQHLVLVLVIITSGFFLCATLANRYHYWERQKIAERASTVSGEKMEQIAPTARYEIDEPYSYFTQVKERLIKIEDIRKVTKQLDITSSTIEVEIAKSTNPQDNRDRYKINFTGVYKIANTLRDRKEIFFDFTPLYNYSIIANLKVEKNNKKLSPIDPNNYSYSLLLSPREVTELKVTYQAEGAPRWVYNAGLRSISNFRLAATSNFDNVDFASGITPTEIEESGDRKIFIWSFPENVSVNNPFGVFTAISPIKNTGVIPRLLLLAPAFFLWWLLLLYLSVPMELKKVLITAGLFFACLLTLTYSSRFVDAKIIWLGISVLLIVLTAGLGSNKRESWAAIICTIAGAIVPIYGFLIPYTGITIGIAGLLSTIWLFINNGSLKKVASSG